MFRTAIFAGVMLALWTLGRPAHAAGVAPFCDDRGATALAAPPALEAPDVAVKRAAAPPCDPDAPIFFGRALGPPRHVPRAIGGYALTATTTEPALQVATPVERQFALLAPESPPRTGVRYRIERPPRG